MFQLFLENFMSPECPLVRQKIRFLTSLPQKQVTPFKLLT